MFFSKSKSEILPADSLYLLPISSENDAGPSNPTVDRGSSCQDYTKRNVLYNHQQYLSCSITQSDSEFSSSKVEPIEHVQSSISKNAEHYLSYIQLQSNDNSKLFQEKRLVWNDIFYRNEHDDYQSILTRTHEYGTFLIRPQSKKSSSSDHDYTLCLYYKLNDIRCFAIYQLPIRKNEYSLAHKGLKSFVDMVHLCEYYRTNPLPMSANNVCLKESYKYFTHEYHYIV
ncbi:unnamed protein product [Rotaria sordida]|uniref:SH2 domain-containing protein n=1 Tax=Rotaria sordida TaxID=392033 RepID=A0A814N8J7_9BILA|nr:unnamed protein product [Rotaria sordida]